MSIYPHRTSCTPKQRATNIVFVMQSAPGIRRKPQKLEGFERTSKSQLLKTAQKVYNSKDSAEDKERTSPMWFPWGNQQERKREK